MGTFDYATSSGVTANVLVGVGNLSLKVPYTAASWDEQGYTIDGLTLTYTPKFTEEIVPWSTFPVGAKLDAEDVILSAVLAQSELDVLRAVLPGVVDLTESDTIHLGRSDRGCNYIGAYIQGHGPSSKRRDVTMAYGYVLGSVPMLYSKTGPRTHLLLFKALDQSVEVGGEKVYPVTIEDVTL